MKILILAPLTRKITPNITAARPRVVFDLICGLKKRGHKISILGTKDSHIKGVEIIPVIKKSFYDISSNFENPFYAHTAFLTKQAKMAEKLSANFDVIHNHSFPEFINLLVEKNIKTPIITTIHAQMIPELDETISLFPKTRIICVSQAAKKLAKKTKIYKVIYHGVDVDLYKFDTSGGDYLLWIGRLGRAKDKNGNFMDGKGVERAIKLARRTNSKLLLSGNVEDIDFFKKKVKPYLSKKIKWIGPVSFEQPLTKKQIAKLMQKAKAFLMMSHLNEAFGLVTAEAQSCGTPAIVLDRGPARELVKNEKTGFVTKNELEMIKAIKKINQMPEAEYEKMRHNCRRHVEENFSIEKMVDNYEEVYYKIIKK